ncbi:hypothetical protein FRC11_004794 [Ceratobasidium sp. 423]|nr:hypothetical protein FRC11_004794 [Ceratobasidium sp. 423]
MFVLVYVGGHHFNVSERTPPVQVIGGTQVASFLPMQSDIVTFLSSIIAILKCALAAWAASLCWYVALFLMERRGLARRNLRALLEYGLLAPSAYSKDWSTLISGALLLAILAANLSSPILTGSISWVPSNRPVHGLVAPIPFGDVEDGTLTELPSGYYDLSTDREEKVMLSITRIGLGWGRETEKGVVKRVSRVVEALAINSTIENVTLPYFQVHSIRWIEDRNEIPAIRDGATPMDLIRAHLEMFPTVVDGIGLGFALLVPNITTNWTSDPVEPTTIHDTRLFILCHTYQGRYYNSTLTQDLPPNTYKPYDSLSYYAFAWVTFSAGVGRCREFSCVVESTSTIRNSSLIELEPHTLTFQALSLAQAVGVHLAKQNSSLPYLWNNINDYVEALLVRSYSASLVVMNEAFMTSVNPTRYIPSVHSLFADVDQKRVYLWLGIQLLVSLLSVLFLIIQSHLSKYPKIGSTTLTAFYLDTIDIPGEVDKSQFGETELLTIEPRGDRFKVKLV